MRTPEGLDCSPASEALLHPNGTLAKGCANPPPWEAADPGIVGLPASA